MPRAHCLGADTRCIRAPVVVGTIAPHRNAVQAQKEYSIMVDLKHPSVVEVLGYHETNDVVFLTIELCPAGELLDHIVGGVSYE